MTLLSRSLLVTTLAMLVACPSRGESPPQIPLPDQYDHPVSLSLVDDSGAVLPVYGHRGQHWVPGQPGRGYRIRLSNSSDQRVLVVLSVDGVNAVTGQTAAPHQTGYVLNPWQTAEVDGWRKSMRETARFVFTDLPDSYASRTGRPDNVGVVGIAVFTERMHHPVYPSYPVHAPPRPPVSPVRGRAIANESTATDAASAPVSVPQQRIGTGHGERSWSPVSNTHFVRASRHPIQVTEFRYDDESGLRAAGVLPRYPTPRPSAPRAFPNGFVPDPPRY